MTFDPVHDAQAIFRVVLDCFSRPAALRDIRGPLSRVDLETALDRGILALAMTLMDPGATFCWMGPGAEAAARFLSGLTDARSVPAGDADFIVAAGGDPSIEEAFREAREGDLLNPQLGATVIALVDSLGDEGDFLASGPGIRDRRSFSLGGRPEAWLEARSARNKEFPMGVDAIVLDAGGAVMALPRTVSVGRR